MADKFEQLIEHEKRGYKIIDCNEITYEPSDKFGVIIQSENGTQGALYFTDRGEINKVKNHIKRNYKELSW